MTPGEVCWIEINTSNNQAAATFYGKLFDWSAEPAKELPFPYHFLRRPSEEKNFGGVMPLQPAGGAPPHWLVYFAVANLDAALAEVTALGGQVKSPVVTLPMGRFAAVADPQGAVFALYQGS